MIDGEKAIIQNPTEAQRYCPEFNHNISLKCMSNVFSIHTYQNMDYASYLSHSRESNFIPSHFVEKSMRNVSLMFTRCMGLMF